MITITVISKNSEKTIFCGHNASKFIPDLLKTGQKYKILCGQYLLELISCPYTIIQICELLENSKNSP